MELELTLTKSPASRKTIEVITTAVDFSVVLSSSAFTHTKVRMMKMNKMTWAIILGIISNLKNLSFNSGCGKIVSRSGILRIVIIVFLEGGKNSQTRIIKTSINAMAKANIMNQTRGCIVEDNELVEMA